MDRGLYLGRFQIFHNGHLSIIEHLDAEPDVDAFVIAVGSSQYDRNHPSPDVPEAVNPFTIEERTEMIRRSIEGRVKKRFDLVQLMDLHVCEQWKKYVLHEVGDFRYFYSNNRREIALFHEKIARPVPIKDRYHAQLIREMIAAGDHFEKYVPSGTASVVRDYDLVRVLKEFYSSHQEELEEIHRLDRGRGILTYPQFRGEST